KSKTLIVLATLTMLSSGNAACAQKSPARKLISLDGTWQIAQGSMDSVPKSFEHTVPVPGLVDMAKPPFTEVGRKSEKRQAFWYRRNFTLEGPVPDVAVLKIHKAKYGTKVFLNGWLLGEHLPCFTSALFDVKKYLKSGDENELVIRLGADRESLPEGMPTGWDFEKYLYIPGIFDSVELILTGAPYIVNVQTVPDISAKKVRVVAEIESFDKTSELSLICNVTEAASGIKVGSTQTPKATLEKNQRKTLELSVPIENCRLWSPEEPFLYQLELTTGADTFQSRFGMRSFRFDKQTGRALLNGKPYIMRGTNVCLYRFFEDSQRADRPWRKEWVRRLHQKFKTMHWNSIRYCIGFPPEVWYQIADEEGFLIQDEFPIWLLDRVPEKLQSEKIIPEYIEWMRERWNHPCVVIWDAQNESATSETGKAIQAVRHLDLSNRPWENGWAEPQSPGDCVESHPYPFIKLWLGEEPFQFSEMADLSPVPYLQPRRSMRISSPTAQPPSREDSATPATSPP
ncbi:MAG: glycoside hydrolase family 2 protein, partial [Planctomycetota bacterium]